MLRYRPASQVLAPSLLLLYMVSVQAAVAFWWYLSLDLWPISSGATLIAVGSIVGLRLCPDAVMQKDSAISPAFTVPGAPFIPGAAIAFNSLLLAQISLSTLV